MQLHHHNIGGTPALDRQATQLLTALIEDRCDLGEDAYFIIHHLEKAGIRPLYRWVWYQKLFNDYLH